MSRCSSAQLSFRELAPTDKITMRKVLSSFAIFLLFVSSIDAEQLRDAISGHALSNAGPAQPSAAVSRVFLIANPHVIRVRRSADETLPSSVAEPTTDRHKSSVQPFLNSSSSSVEQPATFQNHSEKSNTTPQQRIEDFTASFPADAVPSTIVTIPTHSTSLSESKVDPGEVDPSDRNSSSGIANDEATPFPASSTAASTVNSLTGENVTVIEDQNHVYYRSSVTTGMLDSYWANEDVMFGLTEHASLSNSHRSAATIPLSFTFQFYGHEINQVTIATGGFLYMSDFLHQWLTATQYIAPMMANFDTQLGNNSNVHYMDNGSAFIVWWQDVVIDDLRHIGTFNFQAALFVDGRIVFSYKKIPIALKEIPSGEHPVKVGISDAYYVDKPTNSNVKRRTIYEYHRIEINMSQIVNDVVIIITPLPTCRAMKTCGECLLSATRLSFTCQWCPSLRRCSDGLDRQRQKWLETGCPNDRVQSVMSCNQSSRNGIRWDGDILYEDSFRSNGTSSSATGLLLGPSVAGLILIVLGISLLLYLVGWLLYAFSHPNSPSGRWLIEHRPSKLRMRLSHVKFFIQSENGANNYIVSMQQEADGNA